jgi:hypothetical protein
MEWGYLLILLSSILLCAMAAARKEYQRKADATLPSTLVFMGISSFFVCLIGVVYCIVTDFALIRQADGFIVGLGAVFAVILTVNTCLCIFGAKYGSLAVITMFATLGTLVISTVYGLITDPLKNELNGFNIAGLCLAFFIIALSFIAEKYKKKKAEEKTENRSAKIYLFICLAVFLFNGSALSVYSIFTTYRAGYGGFNFIFLYLFFCVLLCAVSLGVFCLHSKAKEKTVGLAKCVSIRSLICTILYGVLFFGAEFCALTTTSLLPIVIQAPLSFAMNVIIVALADYLIYKQKLTKIQLIQIGLALISGVFFAL